MEEKKMTGSWWIEYGICDFCGEDSDGLEFDKQVNQICSVCLKNMYTPHWLQYHFPDKAQFQLKIKDLEYSLKSAVQDLRKQNKIIQELKNEKEKN